MANLSKMRRDRLIAYIEKLKQEHSDDESIMLFNELENALTEKRYGLVFEEHSEEVDELLVEKIPVLSSDPTRRLCKDQNLPWNFIIEGDNLQALYLLEKTHKGKVDCIYIDPPYNSGARDWKYNNDYVDGNDAYRHSKWLSMMKNRLQIAKKLLNPDDSVLIVTIDEKEFLRLGCLLEEMFPAARIQMISDVINPKGVARSGFSRNDEYIFFVMIGSAMPARLPLGNEWSASATLSNSEKKAKGESKPEWTSMMRRGSNSSRTHSPGCYYPIYVNYDKKIVVEIGEPIPAGQSRAAEKPGLMQVLPIRTNGDEGCWQVSPTELKVRLSQGRIKLGRETSYGCVINYLPDGAYKEVLSDAWIVDGYGDDGAIIAHKADEDSEDLRIAPTQWKIASHNASENGSSFIAKILTDKRFTYPKSLYSEHDAIRFFVANKPNAIVVDFFAGSGTTMHAVNLINAEDGGARTCIMVTNNEISEAEEREFKKLGIEKGSDEWESKGIARYVTWPRTVCAINGVDVNGAALKGDYLGTDIPMAKGFNANVKFLKCDWVPRISEDSLAEKLMEHVKEMIELEHALEVDNKKIVLVLSEDEADALEKRWCDYPELNCIYVSKGVLLTTTQNALFDTVEMRTIPDYYFDIELKEVGEAW